jgi:hypothetical protein
MPLGTAGGRVRRAEGHQSLGLRPAGRARDLVRAVVRRRQDRDQPVGRRRLACSIARSLHGQSLKPGSAPRLLRLTMARSFDDTLGSPEGDGK